MKLSCPLCNSQHIYAFHKDKRRDYYRCQPCALVFVDPLSLPDESQELAEYQLHENTLEDDGYLAYLRRLFDCLAPHLRTDMTIAYTGAIRTSIPALSGHPFRFNPDTDSGINQPVFC